jgi:hypothetical protein
MPAHPSRRPAAPRPAAPRLAALALTMLFLVAAVATGLTPEGAAGQASGLKIHEWGTFTSVVGRDGGALAWRPLGVESDLPSFVYSIDRGATWQGTRLHYQTKSASFVRVRMETPVIYFYATRETEISVRVGFPRGKITEWYPHARVAGGHIDWGQLKVLPGAQVELPNDGSDNHYYPARATDAAPLRVSGEGQTEHEKFLFYRGVGDFDLPLFVSLRDGKVTIKSADGSDVGRVILFERRVGKTGHLVRDVPQPEAVLERPTLDGGDPAALRRQLRAILISHGLYEKEADAMLDTWRDSWFEEGLRVFYVLPRKTTDAVLPLNISPRPSELVRVLVGRAELITLEMESRMVELIKRLDDPSAAVRASALRDIKTHGRFTEQILTQVWEHTNDARLRSAVGRLMGELRQRAALPN